MTTQPRVLVIDPPWPQRKGGRRKVRPGQGRALSYETLSVAEIFSLLDREFNLAATGDTVFLWCIDKYLIEAEAAMAARGFKLHARLIWDKGNGVAPAFTVRYTHEYLLWFYKSPMPAIAIAQRGKHPTVFREPGREHSRKPDTAYTLVASLYPNVERWDIFSREPRPGWNQWGDETSFFPKQ